MRNGVMRQTQPDEDVDGARVKIGTRWTEADVGPHRHRRQDGGPQQGHPHRLPPLLRPPCRQRDVSRQQHAGAQQVGRVNGAGGAQGQDGGDPALAQKERHRQDEQHAERARLQHGAEQSLTGHPSFEQEFGFGRNQAGQDVAQGGRMQDDQGRQGQGPLRRRAKVEDRRSDSQQAEQIHAHQRRVQQVERPRREHGGHALNHPCEQRGRLGRVDEPVVPQKAQAGAGQSVQEVLILVGSVKRRLSVGEREGERPGDVFERATHWEC